MKTSLCPKCTDNIPNFEINQTRLFLKCSCGYYSNYTIRSYLKEYFKSKRPHNYNFNCKLHNNLYEYYCENCHFHLCDECLEEHEEDGHKLIAFNDDYFKTMITKGKEHLKYCALIKNKKIQELIFEIEHIDDIYNKTLALKTNLLQFLKECFDEISNNREKKNLSQYNYFIIPKNKRINCLMKDINEIETAYENCYRRNNDLLILLSELSEHYNHNEKVYKNILKNIKINLTPCENARNILVLIEYFTLFYLFNDTLQKNSFILNSNKTFFNSVVLDETNVEVNQCILLKNGMLALAFNHYVRFFDSNFIFSIEKKSINDCHCRLEVTGIINYITQLSDGTLLTCVNDSDLIFWEITIAGFKRRNTILTREYITKIVEISNNRIATLSNNNEIEIWNANGDYFPLYYYLPEQTKNFLTYKQKDILFYRQLNALISISYLPYNSQSKSFISVRNMEKYVKNEKKYELDGRDITNFSKLYQYDKEIIIIRSALCIVLFNLIKGIVEKRIYDNCLELSEYFFKLRNDNILCLNENGALIMIDINSNNVEEIGQDNHMIHLIRIDDKSFVTISDEPSIMQWYY